MVVYAEGDTPELEEEAQFILFDILCKHYPGHPWWVRAYPGGFFIKHMGYPSNFGMNAPDQRKLYSASAYEKLVVMMAGEWLERANMKRGRHEDGQEVLAVEGVPDRLPKPIPDDVKLVIEREPRTAPHRR